MLERYLCALQGYITHINEGCVCISNAEDHLEIETGFIPSDITET